ncbi:hypothetical protein L210DRAFT_1058467 [Boletus edulis BED1]|uniref:Uncharacterized protein n=1 Tax=Boletus edulis BED1 TaxID=1328754 RepID=A0AAD4GIA5_BOLED|nr:hypothetical protein L210DRAFT_1058467 [Boletus edulis BED1]
MLFQDLKITQDDDWRTLGRTFHSSIPSCTPTQSPRAFSIVLCQCVYIHVLASVCVSSMSSVQDGVGDFGASARRCCNDLTTGPGATTAH